VNISSCFASTATPGMETHRLVETDRMRDGACVPLNVAAAKDERVGSGPAFAISSSRRSRSKATLAGLSMPLEVELIEWIGAALPLAVPSKVRIRLRTWTLR
jgi:hypothetical protein